MAKDKISKLKRREAELAAKLEKAEAAKPIDGLKSKVLKAMIADETLPKSSRKAAKAELRARAAGAELTEQSTGPSEEVADGDTKSDAERKEYVKARRLLELAGHPGQPAPDDIDRDNPELVAAYNLVVGKLTGHYITSQAEREVQAERLKDKLEQTEQTATEVETEKGREFAVGTEPVGVEADAEFADPSPAVEVTSRWYRIYNPATGKLATYTRATTYIDNLEDKTLLDRWKQRTLLEGVAINDGAQAGEDRPEPLLPRAAEIMHRRDVELARIVKRDRKGALEKGERGVAEAAVLQAFKSGMDNLAAEALDLGGAHEKAQKGTDLHALTEIIDDPRRGGWPKIKAMHEAGEITDSVVDDLRAYSTAMASAGIKVVEIEQVVVNDELKVAGRLDRVLMVKLPGTQRAVRCVGDLKTGRVDYGTGKIAQQTDIYANAKGYDPADPKARRDLKLNKRVAILVHLPQGEARCSIHVIDLTLGHKGNALSGSVRAWRNEGKAAIDLKTDLASMVEVAS